MARTRNKIDTSKGKRWRWRETFNPIQLETHWSSPFNPKTTRNKGRKNDRQRRQRRWRSTEASRRKIDERKKDWSYERKKERAVRRERERELRVRYREEREKMVKKLYAHATVPVHICTGTVATCIYTQVCTGWCGSFFCSYRVKWAPFSILHNFTSTDVIALTVHMFSCKVRITLIVFGKR